MNHYCNFCNAILGSEYSLKKHQRNVLLNKI